MVRNLVVGKCVRLVAFLAKSRLMFSQSSWSGFRTYFKLRIPNKLGNLESSERSKRWDFTGAQYQDRSLPLLSIPALLNNPLRSLFLTFLVSDSPRPHRRGELVEYSVIGRSSRARSRHLLGTKRFVYVEANFLLYIKILQAPMPPFFLEKVTRSCPAR